IDAFGQGLEPAGRVREATFLYTDLAFGYWLRAPSGGGYRRGGGLNGLAPILELHYNRSLDATDSVTRGNVRVGQQQEDIQILNAVVGAMSLLPSGATLTLGYAFAIGNSTDRSFDGELRVLWNRAY